MTFSKLNTLEIVNETDNHVPENPAEQRRVEENGGRIFCSEHDGSYRVDRNLSITRAFGHRKYKAVKPDSIRIISAKPQVYVWEKIPDMMMILCTDSFTEAICTTPKLMIKNVLGNSDIIRMVSNYLQRYSFDLAATANALCEDQVEKFNFPRQGYSGDNTTIVLMDFDACERRRSSSIDVGEGVDLSASSIFASLDGKVLSGIKRPSVTCESGLEDEEVRPRSVSRESHCAQESSRSTPSSTPRSRRGSGGSSSLGKSRNSSFNTLASSPSPSEIPFLAPIVCSMCKNMFPNAIYLSTHECETETATSPSSSECITTCASVTAAKC